MLERFGRARRLATLLVLAAPLPLSASCKSQGALSTPGADGKVEGDPMVVQGDQAVTRPAALLPANTVFVLSAHSPNRLAEAFERDQLMAELGPLATGATSFLARELGFDPFDPTAYPALGIDPDGEIGIAVIDPAAGVIAIFGKVADAAKLEKAARDAAGRQKIELTKQSFGTATLLRDMKDGRGEGLVIRDDFAAFVMVDRDAPIDYAERMAKQPSADSLARTRGYRRAMGSYDTGDLLVFADVAAIVEQAASSRGDRKSGASRLDEEAKAAKGTGADDAEVAKLQEMAETVRAEEGQWAARDEAQVELWSLLAQGVEGAAFRFSAKQSGVFAEGRVALSESAFLRGALRNTEGRSLFATSLSGEPAFLFEVATDPGAAQDVVELALKADGTSWLQVDKDFESETGVSLDGEVWPMFVGDGGVAMTIDEPLDFTKPAKARAAIGAHFRMRVKDPAAAKAVLERIDASPGEIGKMLEKDKDGERWVADVPDWRKLYVEVAGDHLLVTTDGQLGIRLSHNTRGMMARQTTPPEAWAAMMMPNRASVFAFDVRTVAWLFMGQPDFASSGVSVAFAEDVPMSRAAKAKQKEIDKLDEKIEKVQQKRGAAEFGKIDEALAPFGVSVVTAAMDDRGMDLIGGQLTRNATVGKLLRTMAKLTTQPFGEVPDDGELFELVQQRDKLQNELVEIRQKDAERVGNKSRGGSKRKPAPKK